MDTGARNPPKLRDRDIGILDRIRLRNSQWIPFQRAVNGIALETHPLTELDLGDFLERRLAGLVSRVHEK